MIYVRRIKGSSMSPSLKPGSLLIAVKLKFKSGDVVLAKLREFEVVKRAFFVDNDEIKLVSDNKAQGMDELVDKSTVFARVVWPRAS